MYIYMPTFVPMILVVGFLVTVVAAADVSYSESIETFKAVGIFPYPKDHPFIKELTEMNVSRLLFEDPSPQVLFVYERDDPKVKKISKNVEEFAVALFPIITFVTLDSASTAGKELLQNYGIQDRKTVILMFNSDMTPVDGGGREIMVKMPLPYEGDGSLGHLVRWALLTLSNTPIDYVNDDHTMALFLNFMNHTNMPKVLFITNETSIPPVFKSVAQQFRFVCRSAVAVASESPELIARYKITEFPVVLGFVPQEESQFTVTKMDSKRFLEKEDQNGAIVFNTIKKFYESLEITGIGRSDLSLQIIREEQNSLRKAEYQEKFASALEPILVLDRVTWMSKCLNLKNGICLIIFRDISDIQLSMSDIDKSISGNDFEMMRNITRKTLLQSQVPLQTVLVDGFTNYKIVQSFGINNGIPDAVAIYPQRKKYYNFVGALNEKNLVNLILNKVLRDKQPRQFPKEIPEFIKSETDKKEGPAEDFLSEEL